MEKQSRITAGFLKKLAALVLLALSSWRPTVASDIHEYEQKQKRVKHQDGNSLRSARVIQELPPLVELSGCPSTLPYYKEDDGKDHSCNQEWLSCNYNVACYRQYDDTVGACTNNDLYIPLYLCTCFLVNSNTNSKEWICAPTDVRPGYVRCNDCESERSDSTATENSTVHNINTTNTKNSLVPNDTQHDTPVAKVRPNANTPENLQTYSALYNLISWLFGTNNTLTTAIGGSMTSFNNSSSIDNTTANDISNSNVTLALAQVLSNYTTNATDVSLVEPNVSGSGNPSNIVTTNTSSIGISLSNHSLKNNSSNSGDLHIGNKTIANYTVDLSNTNLNNTNDTSTTPEQLEMGNTTTHNNTSTATNEALSNSSNNSSLNNGTSNYNSSTNSTPSNGSSNVTTGTETQVNSTTGGTINQKETSLCPKTQPELGTDCPSKGLTCPYNIKCYRREATTSTYNDTQCIGDPFNVTVYSCKCSLLTGWNNSQWLCSAADLPPNFIPCDLC